jgi:hypothetical protein
MEVTVNEGMSGKENLRLFGNLNRCICRSHRRVGRCEFSARCFQVSALSVLDGGKQLTSSGAGAPQVVGNDSLATYCKPSEPA